MDLTTLQHTAITVACTVLGWLLGNPVAGYLTGATLVIVREHTQAEYRWIEKYGNGKRDNMPWYGGFDYVVWDLSSLFDWCIPCLVGAVLLGLAYYF